VNINEVRITETGLAFLEGFEAAVLLLTPTCSIPGCEGESTVVVTNPEIGTRCIDHETK